MFAFKPGSTSEFYKIENEVKKSDSAFCKFISEIVFFRPAESKEDKKKAALECRLSNFGR